MFKKTQSFREKSMSTTSKQSMKNKLSLLLAGAALAAVNSAFVLPAYSQERVSSVWDCYLKDHGSKNVGRVTINWGHTEADAAWACDNWNSECGNNGGCFARRI
jgi:hypothetical protein